MLSTCHSKILNKLMFLHILPDLYPKATSGFWQALSKSSHSSKAPKCKSASRRYRDVPVGYRPVRVDWKDLDKCSVCHMDEVEACVFSP